MTPSEEQPGQEVVTGAILLGASTFPEFPAFAPNDAFLHSKEDFLTYLQGAPAGLGVPGENVLDLFDSPEPPQSQLIAIGKFLTDFKNRYEQTKLKNLIVYYVGHGFFAGIQQDYYVALRCIQTDYDAVTSLKVADLAEQLKQRAVFFRRFIFLDCCFAAEALRVFMAANPSDVVAQKADSAFREDVPSRPRERPTKGTVLFCAADKDKTARSPLGLRRTLFTDALLDALRQGDSLYESRMNFQEVRDLVWERLRYIKDTVRPALHTPDQSEGDLATLVRPFPNKRFNPEALGALPRAARADVARPLDLPSPRTYEPTPFPKSSYSEESSNAPRAEPKPNQPARLFGIGLCLAILHLVYANYYFHSVADERYVDALGPLFQSQILYSIANMIAISRAKAGLRLSVLIAWGCSIVFTVPYILLGRMFEDFPVRGVVVIVLVVISSGVACLLVALGLREHHIRAFIKGLHDHWLAITREEDTLKEKSTSSPGDESFEKRD